jgi:hypothetical protein
MIFHLILLVLGLWLAFAYLRLSLDRLHRAVGG